MFAKRIGRSLRQPLNHFLAVNHALIERSWFSSELKANTMDEQPFSGGFKGLVEKATKDRFADQDTQLLHQDTDLNPGAYLDAIYDNKKDFIGRVVVNVGDPGLLSMLAVEAGARHVYTVGAFENADCVYDAGSPYTERISIIKGKMEEIELPEKADILISKPMGTWVVHPKGLKDIVIARDRFLNPNGKMFPSLGRMHMVPVTDECLFNGDPYKSVVKDYDHPEVLLAAEISHTIKFNTIKEEDVYDIHIPLKFTASVRATIHGLACWFDVFNNGSTIPRWLATEHCAPSADWRQFRCILSRPIHVMPGQVITGRLHLVAHRGLSYIIYLTMAAEQGGDLQTSSGKLDLDQYYYGMYESDEDEPTDHLVETKQPFSGGFKGLVEEATKDHFAGQDTQLLHQDTDLNPGAYFKALFENDKDFVDRVVVDVGADTGILSLLAVQAGAKHVYAVGASVEADYICKLGSPFAERITVIKGKIEEIELPEKADILISKPMGTLVVNKKSLKDYVIARDRFLNPNGKMFPSLGRIHMAPFTEKRYGDADKPVVEAYDPKVLVASEISHMLNFNTIKEKFVYNIDIPFKFTASVGAAVQGLAWRFGVYFSGSTLPRWLPTTYGVPSAYWQQFRCFLSKPIHVKPGQEITGRLHLVSHRGLSYIINLTMSAKLGGDLQTSSAKLDLDRVKYVRYESEDDNEDKSKSLQL